MNNPLNEIPLEIKRRIIYTLPVADVLNFAKTNKQEAKSLLSDFVLRRKIFEDGTPRELKQFQELENIIFRGKGWAQMHTETANYMLLLQNLKKHPDMLIQTVMDDNTKKEDRKFIFKHLPYYYDTIKALIPALKDANYYLRDYSERWTLLTCSLLILAVQVDDWGFDDGEKEWESLVNYLLNNRRRDEEVPALLSAIKHFGVTEKATEQTEFFRYIKELDELMGDILTTNEDVLNITTRLVKSKSNLYPDEIVRTFAILYSIAHWRFPTKIINLFTTCFGRLPDIVRLMAIKMCSLTDEHNLYYYDWCPFSQKENYYILQWFPLKTAVEILLKCGNLDNDTRGYVIHLSKYSELESVFKLLGGPISYAEIDMALFQNKKIKDPEDEAFAYIYFFINYLKAANWPLNSKQRIKVLLLFRKSRNANMPYSLFDMIFTELGKPYSVKEWTIYKNAFVKKDFTPPKIRPKKLM